MKAAWALALLIGVLVPGCASIAAVEPLRLSVSNQTSLFIRLRVNEVEMLIAPRGHRDPIPSESLPDAPWRIQVLTESGRLLSSLDVNPGDIVTTANHAQGKAVRVDLSCGRLDVWAGPPLAGPAPPRSFPAGDCDP